MIFTIIVKLKLGIPIQVETNTVQEAITQAGKVVLENFKDQNVSMLELAPYGEWIIREEITQTTVFHMTQALRGLLDLYATVGKKIYEEPAIINALAVLQEAEQANERINVIQEVQNARNATVRDTHETGQ